MSRWLCRFVCLYALVYCNVRLVPFVESMELDTLTLRNESFWKELSPGLHMSDGTLQSYFHPAANETDEVRKLMTKEGYAQLDGLPWDVPLASMVALIDKLRTLGLPITFCYLFDEFWSIFMQLHVTMEGILDVDYQRLPDFWAWRVDPANDEQGWNVHRDKDYETLFVNGAPKTVTVWIPLTDATTSNSCMYVLPADRDPIYRQRDRLGAYWELIAPKIRALPVPVGGALIWNQMVWHWGSQSNKRGTHPRYSLAMEFQAAPTKHPIESVTDAAAPMMSGEIYTIPTLQGDRKHNSGSTGNAENAEKVKSEKSDNVEFYTRTVGVDWVHSDEYGDTVAVYNHPLSHPLELFSFQDRLKLIAKQLLQYSEMYPLSDEMRRTAEELYHH